jgi:UrcA family protein
MKTQLTKRAALAVVVAATGMLVNVALAAEPKGPFAVPELAVKYGDLDLTSPQGVQVLHRRLTAAAERVCPRTDGRISAPDKAAARECRKQAVERAVQEIGSPELAALHAATTPRG